MIRVMVVAVMLAGEAAAGQIGAEAAGVGVGDGVGVTPPVGGAEEPPPPPQAASWTARTRLRAVRASVMRAGYSGQIRMPAAVATGEAGMPLPHDKSKASAANRGEIYQKIGGLWPKSVTILTELALFSSETTKIALAKSRLGRGKGLARRR